MHVHTYDAAERFYSECVMLIERWIADDFK